MIDAAAIAGVIAGLSIAGVSVKNIDAVPLEPYAPALPVLTPNPDTWGGEASIEYGSFGSSTARYAECRRSLGYAYLHAEVGQNASPTAHFKAMTENRDKILTALIECDPGAGAWIESVHSEPLGLITWLSGKSYHGCLLSVVVVEQNNP